MPQSPPPILEYRKPEGGSPSLHRPKAVRHALGNGVACVALSLLLGVPAAGIIGSHSPSPVTTTAILTLSSFILNVLAFFSCGILYIVVSVKIRKPNAFWEKTFCITCAIHIAIVLATLMLLITLTDDGRDRRLMIYGVLALFINVPAIFVLGHMLLLAVYTRWRCK